MTEEEIKTLRTTLDELLRKHLYIHEDDYMPGYAIEHPPELTVGGIDDTIEDLIILIGKTNE